MHCASRISQTVSKIGMNLGRSPPDNRQILCSPEGSTQVYAGWRCSFKQKPTDSEDATLCAILRTLYGLAYNWLASLTRGGA